MSDSKNSLLRSLPSVGALLEHADVLEWLHGLPRPVVTAALQAAVDAARAEFLAGRRSVPAVVEDLLAAAEADLVRRMTPSLRPVINATGIVLHTGLGRAPLPASAIEAIAEGAAGYCNLEFRLETGERGQRQEHVAARLIEVTGAQSATVVNNNAAATLLILATLAKGREVLVSRGQLIEIGGSFRLPDIMTASGAVLREVGTTNRTRLSDYETAITDRTALILRVHPSNYRVVGFTEEASIEELARLAHARGLSAVDDLGSGALFDLSVHGLPYEPCARESLAAGADLVCFSGDKLLGGPQCGIILGSRELIARIEKNPLMRTYRVGKLTLLALEATLQHYLDPHDALQHVPALAMLAADTDRLASSAQALCALLEDAVPGGSFYVCSDVGFAGGGSLPAREIPTVIVQWRPANRPADEIARRLRLADAPVVARVKDDAICFDLRTLREEDFEPLATTVAEVLSDDEDEDHDDPNSIRLPIL